MGRDCGWLALMAAIATGADALFIPECPPARSWAEDLSDSLKSHHKLGKRKCIIIVSEGAIDLDCKPISANDVLKLLQNRSGFDVRVTTLGHVQRGGTPCAFDRYLVLSTPAPILHLILLCCSQ